MRIGNEGGYTKRRRPLLGLVCLLLTGCAQAGASGPDWRLGGPPEAYPRARFVSAVGEGESFEEARGRAKAELTRIFAVEIDSVVELTETETIEEGRRTRRSDFQDRTRARSSLELEGVETPLRWDDPETGRVSVLAVLDRGLECRRLGRDADGVEARFVRALARADEEEGAEPLLALQASHEALGAARTLEALAARSRVLGRACVPPPRPSAGALAARVREQTASLRFHVEAREIDAETAGGGRALPRLRERIAGALSAMGFEVTPDAAAANVPIQAWLRFAPMPRGTAWTEMRFEGAAVVVAGRQPPLTWGADAPERAVLTVAAEGAESHPEPEAARLRARIEGERALAEALSGRLRDFLEPAEAD